MVSIDLEELLQYAKRVEGKTVLLTGGANGIGRETAILFARYGAKVVIGDVNGDAASKVVKEIRELGGNAIYVQCNVLQWEDQITLFESAVSHFGSVDVVVRAWFYPQGPSRLTISSLQIPCAGVSEHGDVCSGVLDYKDGKPLPPDMSTLEINLFGAVHTVHLGLDYLSSTRTGADQWKALILIGILGGDPAHADVYIIEVCHSWFDAFTLHTTTFESHTPILSLTARLVLTGSELLPATRVAQTVLYAATDPDPATSGCSWLLPDNGPIMRLERGEHPRGHIRSKLADLRFDLHLQPPAFNYPPPQRTSSSSTPLLHESKLTSELHAHVQGIVSLPVPRRREFCASSPCWISLPSPPTWLSSVRRSSFVDTGSSLHQSAASLAGDLDLLVGLYRFLRRTVECSRGHLFTDEAAASATYLPSSIDAVSGKLTDLYRHLQPPSTCRPTDILLDTPSALETHIGTARCAMTGMYRGAHAHVQGVVSQRVHRRRD
ncbi:hypothetical protein B0H14DRAFT_3696407 [Mycena olivaceomarginata]|nr:hypothetical protein B0H14DRAFT_3696407 [Mycena olivaceomarginata]